MSSADDIGQRPSQKIEEWDKGDPLTAAALNKTVRALNTVITGVRPPQQRMPKKTAILDNLVQLKVVSIQGDYLTCHNYDRLIGAGSELIYVAKPYLLRASLTSRNSIAYTAFSSDGQQRTATQGATAETHKVTPTYLLNDLIYAVRGVFGGTGVLIGSDELDWIDANLDGRAWAKV